MKLSKTQLKNLRNHVTFFANMGESNFSKDSFIDSPNLVEGINLSTLSPYRIMPDDLKDARLCFIGCMLINPDMPKPVYGESWDDYSDRVIGINVESFEDALVDGNKGYLEIVSYVKNVSVLIGKPDMDEQGIIDMISFRCHEYEENIAEMYRLCDKYKLVK